MKCLIIVALILTAGCSNNDRIPDGIMGKEKMEGVLWDMILADRFSSQFLAKDSSKIDLKTETLVLYEQVFQIHKVKKEDFIKSYKYYLSRPDITKVIFDTLAARANSRKNAAYEKTMAK